MVDLDGKFEYSKQIIIKHTLNVYIDKCYPDVIEKNGQVNINMISNNEQKLTVSVYSINGMKIHEQVQMLSKGSNTFYVNGFNKESSGLYILKFSTGNFTGIRKVIVH